MPIHHELWTTGDEPRSIPVTQLGSERALEDMIVKAPQILSENWMLIGRQLRTGLGGIVDLLAIAPDGSLVLIELKRNLTPRDVVGQSLDYASWVETLDPERVATIYSEYTGGASLREDFTRQFNASLADEDINQAHQIVILAAELDPSTERIVGYLNDRDVPINVLFFQVFQIGDQRLLSRAWMIDPTEVQENAATVRTREDHEPWNGEFYVNFGADESRSWDEAVKYGFVSAGFGAWYTNSLNLLSKDDRVWVKIPGSGFVGVGRVTGPRQSAKDFEIDGQPALDILEGDYLRDHADDPDKSEYFVPVEWLDTVPQSRSYQEVGFFGNQNTVCRPSTKKWRHTVEKLKERFANFDG